MNIDSTIYIKCELLAKVQDAAARMGLSRNKVILLLMRRVSEKKELEIHMFHRIHYQLRDGEPGRRIHVWLPPQVYETFQDLRKIHKMSISAIIAFAIHEYLEILLEEPASPEEMIIADNYHANYLFGARESGGIQKFVIYWGFPEENHLEEYFT
ncbi:MAG: hypothetical protein GY754_05435 [bacterium]|nr:hypothetical protein [bacterium]